MDCIEKVTRRFSQLSTRLSPRRSRSRSVDLELDNTHRRHSQTSTNNSNPEDTNRRASVDIVGDARALQKDYEKYFSKKDKGKSKKAQEAAVDAELEALNHRWEDLWVAMGAMRERGWRREACYALFSVHDAGYRVASELEIRSLRNGVDGEDPFVDEVWWKVDTGRRRPSLEARMLAEPLEKQMEELQNECEAWERDHKAVYDKRVTPRKAWKLQHCEDRRQSLLHQIDAMALEAVKIDKEELEPQYEKAVRFVRTAKAILQSGEITPTTPADVALELWKTPPQLVDDYWHEFRPIRRSLAELKALADLTDSFSPMVEPRKEVKRQLRRLQNSPHVIDYPFYESLLHEKDPFRERDIQKIVWSAARSLYVEIMYGKPNERYPVLLAAIEIMAKSHVLYDLEVAAREAMVVFSTREGFVNFDQAREVARYYIGRMATHLLERDTPGELRVRNVDGPAPEEEEEDDEEDGVAVAGPSGTIARDFARR